MTTNQTGRTIAALRKEKGLTQKALALLTDGKIKTTQLANYEQGIREPGIDELLVLAKALRVTAGYLAGFTLNKEPLSKTELELIKCFRQLPAAEQDEYLKKLRAINIIFTEPARPSYSRSELAKANK
jgi:transcriptional regulator with XRE-family HTH domain